MALSRGKASDMPKDAVEISRDEALLYQMKIISNWENPKEVWAFKYTPAAVATVTVATSMYVNNFFRRKLKLGRFGQVSTYLPIVVLPAMLSMISHKLIIQRSVILDSLKQCPLCLQMRAAAVQGGIGVVYPMLLAPLSSCMMATRYFTYRLPSITENPKEVFQFLRKLSRPLLPTMGIAIGVQSILTMFLTYKEMEQHLLIQLKMSKIEKQIDEDRMSNIE